MQKRHNKYVAGIKELINNSTYSHTGKNDKPKEKPNILNYHYFDVNIRIGDKTYPVRLECEENKKVPQGRYAKRSKQSHQNISNLTQKNNNVKIVHLYNIKEMKSPKTFYQDGKQQNLIVDNAQRNRVARKMKLVKGAYSPDENFITLFKGADHSTIEHELAHLYLDVLTYEAQNSEEIQGDLDAVRKFVGNNGEKFTTEQHEKFARGFEAYLRTGSARTNKLKKLFEG